MSRKESHVSALASINNGRRERCHSVKRRLSSSLWKWWHLRSCRPHQKWWSSWEGIFNFYALLDLSAHVLEPSDWNPLLLSVECWKGCNSMRRHISPTTVILQTDYVHIGQGLITRPLTRIRRASWELRYNLYCNTSSNDSSTAEARQLAMYACPNSAY